MLKCNGFYLKSWESLDKEHTQELNVGLPKEMVTDKTTRERPSVSNTHKEINKLQKTIEDESLIHTEENEIPSVTQLGHNLTQWTYRIKSKIASYQRKSNPKVVFNIYEEAEEHLELTSQSKHQLCSLLHNFTTLLTLLFHRPCFFRDSLGENSMIQEIWNGM